MRHPKTAHISVDDTIWLFYGLRDWDYGSVFEQPVLGLFHRLHERCGIAVSFYCFMRQDWMCLKDVPDKYREELEENRDWLRFGFHAIDENADYARTGPKQAAEDYRAVTAELRRIAGESSLDLLPRIHKYAASQDCLLAMKEQGLRGVLTPEEGWKDSYGLSREHRAVLNDEGVYEDRTTGLTYLATDIRLEETASAAALISQLRDRQHLEVFTHEWALEREHMQEKLTLCCDLLHKFGYEGAFWGREQGLWRR